MFDKTIRYGLTWDLAVSETVEASQRWILSSMQRHGQELVTMLWRILGNEQDVCDAYQTTFLRLAHFENGQKPRCVKAYVFRTASNVAISMLRRKILETALLTAGGCSTAAPGCSLSQRQCPSPANEFDSKYLQEKLRAGIARLPEQLREVVTLRDLAELPYAQVGKIMGISTGTARVYRCKAIQLLAVWMSRKNENDYE